MSLFQNSVLNKYLNDLDSQKVIQAYQSFTNHFHNPTIQENIRNSKEEQYQGEFLIDLFVNVFGYTKNPTPHFNLTTELKNIKDSKKTDGAILKGEKALAVIELKGTNTTDLSKVEAQAFGYKNNQPGCKYVITSNFEKLRFYIDNAVDFEEFNLFQLSRERFNVLYLCLSAEYLLKDIPKRIKDESLTREENITKELYKDYAAFRNELFDSIQTENPQHDKLTLFKKTQKLLDRFLFVFFAEDRLLLPPNSIRSIVNQWTELRDKYDEYFPLYDRFKKYFGYMNTGHKGQQHDIFAYNGGLFTPDAVLDNITINDDLLYKHTLILSNYDFQSEVSVNILGHIFEHSLNDIDEIQAEIQGVATEQSKTKRKKDGVFYTPKYIAKYIVDNTVGKLCEAKKTELDIDEAEYEKDRKGRKKATLKSLTQKLEDYRKWLLQITICDPACGSGAFLNQALEFLIAEHRYIDELQAKLFGDAMILSEVENAILEYNLFGVDINEESVEIAKLSLWLRTAQKGRKLTSLNHNIKCGNSLIDDPTVAGDKAFNWENEFPSVFAKGGFDVVIGNPPYVRLQNIDENSRNYFASSYKTAFKNYDLYVLFTEKINTILKSSGEAAFIMPNKFITTEYGEKLKELLFEKQFLSEYIDFSDFQVFDDATTYTGIFVFNNNLKQTINYYKVTDEESKFLINVSFTKVNYLNLKDERWIFMDEVSSKLFHRLSELDKIKDSSTEMFVGLQTSADPVFILEIRGNRLYSKYTNKYYDFDEYEILKPLLKGAEIKRYSTPIPNYKLIFPYKISGDDFRLLSEEDMINNYLGIWEYLKECKLKLEGRENGKMKNERWYGYVYLKNMTLFDRPKILTQVLCKQSSLSLDLDNKNYFVGGGTAGGYGVTISNDVNPYSLIAILNSRLTQWYIKQFASPFQGGYYAYNKGTIGEIPLPILNSDQNSHENIVSKIKDTNDDLYGVRKRFIEYVSSKFLIEKLSKKLQNWQDLTFSDFIKELNKAIKATNKARVSEELVAVPELTKKDEFEWMELFEENKQKAQTLQSQIAATEKEIDHMVYKLYGLTEEEVAIVENS